MTYEPGEQVLVRGELRALHRGGRKGIFAWTSFDVEITDISQEGERAILLEVHPADVVGPAPATPSQTTYEARIAAALTFHQPVPDDGGGWCECSYAYPCATRRALSVEATDTEGGD
jgi:hypothetical protein